jgi:lipoprotein-anchoring transpeptidase ErfK/SrfK
MSRFATALISTTGLLLVSTLAIFPTQLHAQGNPKSTPVNAGAPTATTPKTPNSPTTTVPTISAPVTGASISTPNKPVINNSLPTAGKNPPAKPSVATTTTTPAPAATDPINLILKLKERKVYVYNGSTIVAKYPVAVGKKGWETPTGDWYVMEKITNPGWTSFKNGSTIKPGAKNPLGERWIGFWTDGKDVIGFHGTPDPSSVGKAVSHGCVRMFDKDVKALFPLVKVGTTVKVVNE